MMLHTTAVFSWIYLVYLISARAPEDAELICTDEFASPVPSPIYHPNLRVLMDSYWYVNLLPPQDGPAWTELDTDSNNEMGRGTEVFTFIYLMS